MNIKDELYTIEDVARILRVEKRTIYKWMEKGMITYIRFNKKTIRFRPSDLENFIQKHTFKKSEIDEVVDEILSRLS